MRYERSNKKMIKQVNRRSILRVLWHRESASRAEIARIMQLNPATITNLTRELIAEDWLIETGEGDSSGGRPPVLLKLNRKMMQMIGVDVGIHNIKFGLVNGEGEFLQAWNLSLCEVRSGDDLFSYIKEGIQTRIQNLDRVLGIGIAMHGFVDRNQGIIRYAPAFEIENFSLREKLVLEFDCEVLVENDVRAMAIGERWFGLARNNRDYFLINIGDGVGGALSMDGKIHSGGGNMAGEIGHVAVSENDGIRCSCGKTGCLETEISSLALARKYRERTGKPCENGEELFQKANEGDGDAQSVFREMGSQLGQALAWVVQLLNPERIIVAGGVSRAWDAFAPQLLEALEVGTMTRSYAETRIEPTRLQGKSGVLGAATLVIEAWMEVQEGGNGE